MRRAHRDAVERLEAGHRGEIAARDANFAQQAQRLADCADAAAQCAKALEAEKHRSNQHANQLDQLAGQLGAERIEAAAQLKRVQDAHKAAAARAATLESALDEIRRVVETTSMTLGEASTALDQIRVAAGNGEASWPAPAAAPGAAKPH